MFLLQGQIINEFNTPSGENRVTGEKWKGRSKVQILVGTLLKNGETRNDLLTLSCGFGQFSGLIGKQVQIPIGVAVIQGKLAYRADENVKPKLLEV